MSSSPSDEIPDFILETLSDQDPDALRAIADFAVDSSSIPPDPVPDTLVEAFALQDEKTCEAISAYASALADAIEEGDVDPDAEATGDEGSEENGDGDSSEAESDGESTRDRAKRVDEHLSGSWFG